MFEVHAYIGRYRKTGFTSYQDAAEHAREMVRLTGQPHCVYETIRRCIINRKDLTNG